MVSSRPDEDYLSSQKTLMQKIKARAAQNKPIGPSDITRGLWSISECALLNGLKSAQAKIEQIAWVQQRTPADLSLISQDGEIESFFKLLNSFPQTVVNSFLGSPWNENADEPRAFHIMSLVAGTKLEDEFLVMIGRQPNELFKKFRHFVEKQLPEIESAPTIVQELRYFCRLNKFKKIKGTNRTGDYEEHKKWMMGLKGSDIAVLNEHRALGQLYNLLNQQPNDSIREIVTSGLKENAADNSIMIVELLKYSAGTKLEKALLQGMMKQPEEALLGEDGFFKNPHIIELMKTSPKLEKVYNWVCGQWGAAAASITASVEWVSGQNVLKIKAIHPKTPGPLLALKPQYNTPSA